MKKETRHKLFILAMLCLMVCTRTLRRYDGMRLPDEPDVERITKIIVEHTDYPGDTRKYVDTTSINMAEALLETLRYEAVRTPTDGEPVARLTYVLDDGSEVTVEANEQTVWWKGKTYAIYNTKTGQFVKQCARHFFEDPLDPYQEYRDKYSTD